MPHNIQGLEYRDEEEYKELLPTSKVHTKYTFSEAKAKHQ